MDTRRKNKSAHPGLPDMTPSQVSSAGLSRTPAPRRKKATKDQQISALQDELRSIRELLSEKHSNSRAARRDQAQDADGDTDPGTDMEAETVAVGMKRKGSSTIGTTSRLKRSRAMDPFESSSMAHGGATGLVDNWRTVISPYGTASPRSLTLNLRQITDHDISPLSPTNSTTMVSGASTPTPFGASTLSPFSVPTPNLFSPSTPSPFGLDDLSSSTAMISNVTSSSSFTFDSPVVPTFTLPRIIKGAKVFPGIKDLPMHLRQNFRNEFIRFVIKQVANSPSPWVNPDLNSLQCMYQLVYPTFPARLRHSDAVYHPTISALGVLRNHLASAAIVAMHRHMSHVFRSRRLHNIEARAGYVAQLFQSDDDHPIIWREYIEGDIQNHPEIGGYKTVRRGVFQSDPILETLLSYYSSSGILEAIPTEDPGPGNRPSGILALVTAAVERAHKTYATGDFIEPTHQFNSEFWGPRTTRYTDYIINDLSEKHWNSIFTALAVFAIRVSREEAVHNGAPEEPRERVPLPPSDPPSPPHDD